MIPPILLAEVRPRIHVYHGIDAQPNSPHIFQTPQPSYNSSSWCYFLWEFVDEEEKCSEQHVSLAGDGNVRYGNGAKVFASLLRWWWHNHVFNFYLCLLCFDCQCIGMISKCAINEIRYRWFTNYKLRLQFYTCTVSYGIPGTITWASPIKCPSVGLNYTLFI